MTRNDRVFVKVGFLAAGVFLLGAAGYGAARLASWELSLAHLGK